MAYQSTADQAPFSAWFRQQSNRDDIVGELARDYWHGMEIGEHQDDFKTAGDFKGLLRGWPNKSWKPAYRQAKAEFKEFRKQAAGGDSE